MVRFTFTCCCFSFTHDGTVVIKALEKMMVPRTNAWPSSLSPKKGTYSKWSGLRKNWMDNSSIVPTMATNENHWNHIFWSRLRNWGVRQLQHVKTSPKWNANGHGHDIPQWNDPWARTKGIGRAVITSRSDEANGGSVFEGIAVSKSKYDEIIHDLHVINVEPVSEYLSCNHNGCNVVRLQAYV